MALDGTEWDVVFDRCAAERITMGTAAGLRECWSGWHEASRLRTRCTSYLAEIIQARWGLRRTDQLERLRATCKNQPHDPRGEDMSRPQPWCRSGKLSSCAGRM